MTVKNLDLLRCVTPMKLLCEKEGIDFLTAIAISQNAETIDRAIEKYLAKKDTLSEKYILKENGSETVRPGCEEEFLRELTALNENTVELSVKRISPSCLASVTFPPKYVQSIMFMLDIREE